MKRIFTLAVMMIVMLACDILGGTPVPSTQIIPGTDTPPQPTEPPGTGSPASVTPTTAPAGDATSFPDPNRFKWAPVTSGLESPIDIQFPDDGSGRMFVLQQPGRIALVKDGQWSQTAFLDIQQNVGSSGNEQGLLGLAFHPDFKNNPYFYVNYTDTNGDTVIARFQANGDTADPGSQKDLIHVDQPYANHNGGVLIFGPDGYLYAGLGDGGSAGDPHENGQNKGVLLGKVLRIDVDHGDPYAVPADNPFGSEVWHYGLRNPWRISFDRATGDLFIADVGQDAWEEVDVAPAGKGGLNFGWNYREGAHNYSGSAPVGVQLTEPVAEYSHKSSRCSVTGGFVYRGAMPEWQGIYLYGDYCSGEIWGLLRTGGDPGSAANWTSQLLFQTGDHITTFGQDPTGEIYYADQGGTIFKLQK